MYFWAVPKYFWELVYTLLFCIHCEHEMHHSPILCGAQRGEKWRRVRRSADSLFVCFRTAWMVDVCRATAALQSHVATWCETCQVLLAIYVRFVSEVSSNSKMLFVVALGGTRAWKCLHKRRLLLRRFISFEIPGWSCQRSYAHLKD